MILRVVWQKLTDVSEVLTASIIRPIALQLVIFILVAARTSNLDVSLV
jgi:hypothetical protein